ncbi:MAG: extracellular solute-binding protein [Planctomycetota bacterium]
MNIRSLLTVLPFVLLGCAEEADVTLYVALDEEHSKQIVRRFEEETGLTVNARFDAEAQKTVGLVNAIRQEAENPRCDVFWNNELAHTVALGQLGLLEPYESSSAAGIPAQYRSAENTWTGFASRARVLIVNTEALPDRGEWPTSVEDFTDPKWRGKCAVARPLTGTTLTHFTALRERLGEARFEEWVQGMIDNDVQFLQSNGATMRSTADSSNEIVFALTDTDDFHVALSKGLPVSCVFPDQGEGQMGTMLIPNSIALIKGGPNAENAKRLIDFVLSEQVEGLLAAAKSAQIPLRASVTPPPSEQILKIGSFRQMEWDPEATASALADRIGEFQDRFSGSR